MTTFRAETYQNEYLAVGATSVDAVVTVSASGSGTITDGHGSGLSAAEIIIVDVSGSMDFPRTKIRAARDATAAAIDSIRDGVRFAVLAGTDYARRVYPDRGGLAVASGNTKREAKNEVSRLKAGGGTAMGSWLHAANELFVSEPAGIRHAILLTDGQNADETPEGLDLVLDECEGNFQCDCRGVGADWEVSELREIATKLLGEVDLIRKPKDMAADFQALMERAMGKHVSDVALRLWTPQGATVAFVKQVVPEVSDLTPRRTAVSELVGDYPTGAWGDEARDYHLQISVPGHDVGDEMLAGRVSLVVDGEVVSEARIRAAWTDDERLSTRKDRRVEEHRLRVEYADAVTEYSEAREAGDVERATDRLTRAEKIARELEDQQKLDLIGLVGDVDATGKVTPKSQVDPLDEMEMVTRSVKTDRTRKPDS